MPEKFVYEFMVRGDKNGLKAAHVIYAREIDGVDYPEKDAKPLDTSGVAEWLGSNFGETGGQLLAAREELKTTAAKLATVTEERDTLKTALAENGETIKAMETDHVAAVEKLNADHAATVAALNAQIDALKGAKPAGIVYMSDLWDRATDKEATDLEAMISALTAKDRQRLFSSQWLDPAHPDFPRILQALTATVGEERARVLIAPSGV